MTPPQGLPLAAASRRLRARVERTRKVRKAESRWQSPGLATTGPERTKYRYARYQARFEAFRATVPELSLEEVAFRFLRGLPPPSRQGARSALKLAYPDLRWPLIRFPPPRRDEAKLLRSIFSEEERERLRAVVGDPRDRAIVAALWTLRQFEAAKLRWGDVDFERGLIFVLEGKGGVSSWTLLTKQAREDLWAWYEAAGHPRPSDPVFRNQRGEPVTARCIWARTHALLTRAGLHRPGRGTHAFRRTFATVYLRQNPGDIRGLQQLLRHERIETTAKYCFLQPEDLRARLPNL